ncbi:MbtH family protein [Micromonospora arida]|uniref:MbtH family protein n=1 Tax=Micromonospora arida TaxID=2203715 RepID=UPI0036B5F506
MTTNPFDDSDGRYVVLANDEGQHSLWPEHLDVPAGWAVVRESGSKQECLDYVETHWTDLRPKSLIKAMNG